MAPGALAITRALERHLEDGGTKILARNKAAKKTGETPMAEKPDAPPMAEKPE